MPNYPIPVSKDEFLAVLDDIRAVVIANDSFEGRLEYTMPEPGDPPTTQFRLKALYRVGNRMGQGGVKVVGSLEPERPSEEDARAALDGETST